MREKISFVLIWLDRLHWLWLVLAAPFLLFPSPSRSLVMLVIPALWLLHWVVVSLEQGANSHQAGKEDHGQYSEFRIPSPIIPQTPLNGALLLMATMVLVSLWATYDIAVSLSAISGTVLGIGVYYAFVRLSLRIRGWWMCLTFFLISITGLAIVGLFGITWIAKIGFLSPIILHIPPLLIGLPGVDEGLHPNEVAGGLLWGIGLLWCLSFALIRSWIVARSRGWKSTVSAVSLAASIFVTGVFVLTQSRGAYIGLVLTLSVLILIALPPKWRWYSLAVPVLTIILGMQLASRGEAGYIWFSNLAEVPTFSLNTFSSRLEVWSRAVYGIQDFPFTGMGMNTFRKVVSVLYPVFTFSSELDIPHAHNEFLQVALDLGIPGLVAFIALYLGTFWMLFQIWRDCSSQILPIPGVFSHRWLVVGLGSGLLGHLLYSLTDAIQLGSKYGLLFWMLLGLIAGLHRQSQAQNHVAATDGSVLANKCEMDDLND